MIETSDDLCLRCNYDLRGIADDSPCPECGLKAGRSRMPTDELRHARPKWLMKISWGIRLILAGELIVWLLIAFTVLSDALLWRGLQPIVESEYFLTVILTIAAVNIAVGVWLVSCREGRALQDRLEARRRWMMRLAVVIPLAGVGVFCFAATGRFLFISEWLLLTAAGALTVGAIPLPAIGFYHLRSLARRVMDPGLAEHSAIVGWGMSLTLAAIASLILMAYIRYRIDADVMLWVMLAISVASLLFLIWSTYLMIWFCIQFAQASEAARRAWDDADLARE